MPSKKQEQQLDRLQSCYRSAANKDDSLEKKELSREDAEKLRKRIAAAARKIANQKRKHKR
ncbi:MAG: hypothetical protein AAF542_19465 [Pseudomonadota bacterium]